VLLKLGALRLGTKGGAARGLGLVRAVMMQYSPGWAAARVEAGKFTHLVSVDDMVQP